MAIYNVGDRVVIVHDDDGFCPMQVNGSEAEVGEEYYIAELHASGAYLTDYPGEYRLPDHNTRYGNMVFLGKEEKPEVKMRVNYKTNGVICRDSTLMI